MNMQLFPFADLKTDLNSCFFKFQENISQFIIIIFSIILLVLGSIIDLKATCSIVSFDQTAAATGITFSPTSACHGEEITFTLPNLDTELEQDTQVLTDGNDGTYGTPVNPANFPDILLAPAYAIYSSSPGFTDFFVAIEFGSILGGDGVTSGEISYPGCNSEIQTFYSRPVIGVFEYNEATQSIGFNLDLLTSDSTDPDCGPSPIAGSIQVSNCDICPCTGNPDFSAPPQCSGENTILSPGPNCTNPESQINPNIQRYSYLITAYVNELGQPIQAPANFDPIGLSEDVSDFQNNTFPDLNLALLNVTDQTDSDFCSNPIDLGGIFINTTCDPLTISLVIIPIDFDSNVNGDGSFGDVVSAEDNGCPSMVIDIVVYPIFEIIEFASDACNPQAGVFISNGNSNYYDLNEDGIINIDDNCAMVEMASNNNCVDGETLEYDFTNFDQGNCSNDLTGSLTCVCASNQSCTANPGYTDQVICSGEDLSLSPGPSCSNTESVIESGNDRYAYIIAAYLDADGIPTQAPLAYDPINTTENANTFITNTAQGINEISIVANTQSIIGRDFGVHCLSSLQIPSFYVNETCDPQIISLVFIPVDFDSDSDGDSSYGDVISLADGGCPSSIVDIVIYPKLEVVEDLNDSCDPTAILYAGNGNGAYFDITGDGLVTIEDACATAQINMGEDCINNSTSDYDFSNMDQGNCSVNLSGTLNCACEDNCLANSDYSAAPICSGEIATLIPGANCSNEEAFYFPGEDRFAYLIGIYLDGDGKPGMAPDGYDPISTTIDIDSYISNAGSLNDLSILEFSPNQTGFTLGAQCSNSISLNSLITNNTCDPITVSIVAMQMDWNSDVDGDNLTGDLISVADGGCPSAIIDLIVYPKFEVRIDSTDGCHPLAANLLIDASGNEVDLDGDGIITILDACEIIEFDPLNDCLDGSVLEFDFGPVDAGGCSENLSGTFSCNCPEIMCDANPDYSAPPQCSGANTVLIPGANCNNAPSISFPEYDQYAYAAFVYVDSFGNPTQAPSNFEPVSNTEEIDIFIDSTVADLGNLVFVPHGYEAEGFLLNTQCTTNLDLGAILVNNTCLPITASIVLVQYDWDSDKDNDGFVGEVKTIADGGCPSSIIDIVVHPKFEAIEDLNDSCDPIVGLFVIDTTNNVVDINGDGSLDFNDACAVSQLTPTADCVNGQSIPYDFTAFDAGNCSQNLTGTLTCNCTPPVCTAFPDYSAPSQCSGEETILRPGANCSNSEALYFTGEDRYNYLIAFYKDNNDNPSQAPANYDPVNNSTDLDSYLANQANFTELEVILFSSNQTGLTLGSQCTNDLALGAIFENKSCEAITVSVLAIPVDWDSDVNGDNATGDLVAVSDGGCPTSIIDIIIYPKLEVMVDSSSCSPKAGVLTIDEFGNKFDLNNDGFVTIADACASAEFDNQEDCGNGALLNYDFSTIDLGGCSTDLTGILTCTCNEICGCQDPTACNYDANANCDDGSCTYSPCNPGCTDPCAANFDATADEDDGSCDSYDNTCNSDCSLGDLTEWNEATCSCEITSIVLQACTDPTADNYNALANCDDGSCTFTIMGCTDPCSGNYDPAAELDDGNCEAYNNFCNSDCTAGPRTIWDPVSCSCILDLTNPCPEDCGTFEVEHFAICAPDLATYEVLITVQSEDNYIITDNNTGFVLGPVNSFNFTFGPFDAGTGYSYSIAPATNPDCYVTLGQSITDCQTTEVELINFDGKISGNDNQLNWTTGTEKNSSHFILEYSENGFEFGEITRVQTTGNSNIANSYEFIHSNISVGTHYYRLSEVDIYGNLKIISKVIALEHKTDFKVLSIYPVPVLETLNVAFQAENKEEFSVRIYDLSGKELNQKNFQSQKGLNTLQYSVQNYPVGYYIIKISNGTNTIIEKFVKF